MRQIAAFYSLLPTPYSLLPDIGLDASQYLSDDAGSAKSIFCRRLRACKDMRILLTGATGFAGGHLAEALLAQQDVALLGISRYGRWPADTSHLECRVPLHVCDLKQTASIAGLLGDWRPDQIYHLAGYAQVGQSFREPDAAWCNNLDATRCLLEAVTRWGERPRILFVGSGLIYGGSETPNQACDEQSPLRPESPYAASKAAADLLGYQMWRSTGLEIVRARPFNHLGPRQSPDFAVSHFAKQIVEIERGRRGPILETGDLRPRRDLTDVRDIVLGYLLAMNRGRAGDVYNLGSGHAHSMGEILDRLLRLARVRCQVRPCEELLRDAETAVLRADATKAGRDLSWAPQIPLQQTLTDILAFWRHVL
jgi:GDP-4-dehydro-6-deoxy-D-mannose reductase